MLAFLVARTALKSRLDMGVGKGYDDLMINHTNCEHPSTSSARAKCRRGIAQGNATPKIIDTRDGTPTGRPRTPSDPAKCCDICGVERISAKGTPPIERRLIFVGPKCEYYLNDAPDITPID